MGKDTYYFSHDYNTRANKKIKPLLAKHAMIGYGVYWAIIEDLYNNSNRMPLDYEVIAYDLRVSVDLVKSIIHDFKLFLTDESHFSCEGIKERLEERNTKKNKAKESAKKRWDKLQQETQKGGELCERNANALKNDANASNNYANASNLDANASEIDAIKERKGKEIKGKENYTSYVGINDDDNKGGGGNFEPNPLHIPGVEPFQHIEVIATEYLTSPKYEASRQQLCISLYIKPDALEKIVAEFNAMLTIETKTQRQAGDWVSHLRNWIKKTGRNSPQVNTSTKVDKTQEILLKRQSKIS